MIYVECEQGTQEWITARAGTCTASRFSVARERMKVSRNGRKAGDPSAACEKYAMLLACERIGGTPLDDAFQTYAMRRGIELEPMARQLYEAKTGHVVEPTGIAFTDDRFFGYSSDGAVYGQPGRIEIKCPMAGDTVAGIWLDPEPVIDEYRDQIQGGLWITGAQWVDLVVYTPWLASVGKDLFVQRIYRDERYIEELEADLLEFWRLSRRYEDALRATAAPRDAAPPQRDAEPEHAPAAALHKLDVIARQVAVNTIGDLKETSATVCASETSEAATTQASSTPPATSVAAAQDNLETTIKLGDICERLGFHLTEHFITEVLHISSSGRQRNAVLYSSSDRARIKTALLAHIVSLA